MSTAKSHQVFWIKKRDETGRRAPSSCFREHARTPGKALSANLFSHSEGGPAGQMQRNYLAAGESAKEEDIYWPFSHFVKSARPSREWMPVRLAPVCFLISNPRRLHTHTHTHTHTRTPHATRTRTHMTYRSLNAGRSHSPSLPPSWLLILIVPDGCVEE